MSLSLWKICLTNWNGISEPWGNIFILRVLTLLYLNSFNIALYSLFLFLLGCQYILITVTISPFLPQLTNVSLAWLLYTVWPTDGSARKKSTGMEKS